MSFLDKIAAAIMPAETEQDRANARRIALAAAGEDDWLSAVLDHHQQIEAAFEKALADPTAQGRTARLKELEVLLTGHSNAEEAVLYPALVEIGEKSHAGMAYEEQATTKIQLAKIEKLDPMSDEWREKLEHVRAAVLHHTYEEEGKWFPELQANVPAVDRGHLSRRFLEEFERYVGARQTGQTQAPRTEPGAPPPHMGAADY